MRNLFTEHPHKVGKTYFSHAGIAMSYSFLSMKNVYYFFVHALFPFIFKLKGGEETQKIVDDINKKMKGM